MRNDTRFESISGSQDNSTSVVCAARLRSEDFSSSLFNFPDDELGVFRRTIESHDFREEKRSSNVVALKLARRELTCRIPVHSRFDFRRAL